MVTIFFTSIICSLNLVDFVDRSIEIFDEYLHVVAAFSFHSMFHVSDDKREHIWIAVFRTKVYFNCLYDIVTRSHEAKLFTFVGTRYESTFQTLHIEVSIMFGSSSVLLLL